MTWRKFFRESKTKGRGKYALGQFGGEQFRAFYGDGGQQVRMATRNDTIRGTTGQIGAPTRDIRAQTRGEKKETSIENVLDEIGRGWARGRPKKAEGGRVRGKGNRQKPQGEHSSGSRAYFGRSPNPIPNSSHRLPTPTPLSLRDGRFITRWTVYMNVLLLLYVPSARGGAPF